MGCVSSHLLNQDDDFTQISHHIVSLTSSTYGLLTLDPSSSPTTLPPTPTTRFTLGSYLHTPLTEPTTEPPPEVIDSLELMAGLDSTPEPSLMVLENAHKFQENAHPDHKNQILSKPGSCKPVFLNGFQENANPDHKNPILIKPGSCKPVFFDGFQENEYPDHKNRIFNKPGSYKPVFSDGFQENGKPDHKNRNLIKPGSCKPVFLNGFQENGNPDYKNRILIKPGCYKPVFLDGFEELCPPKGENRVVIYTTTLRGVRKTFEACNAVRAVLEGFGVAFCERDISMDRGFKQELWELMKGKDKCELVPPRVFVKGRYVGGSDEVLRIVEEGCLGKLLEGLPKAKVGYVCEVCGGARFLPCVVCNGSCKVVVVLKKGIDGKQLGKSVTVKCSDCNENGLVCCPICS
ncbi:putative glutaredoxin, Thioredoxin-like superfamily [Helianthus annuus]|nr:putative glutaredoxin, Thioredoxin-like superfamily [Helianthus annuus]